MNNLHLLYSMELVVQLDQIHEAARMFLQKVEGKVFALHGEMGAGKTTFISALCVALGVSSGTGSPTFSLINEYVFVDKGKSNSIFHLDLYRIKDEAEAINAGVEDCLYSGSICFVEWPEKISSLLPDDTVHVYLTVTGEKSRLLKIADSATKF